MTLAQFIEKHGPSEAAKILAVSRMTLYRWADHPEKITPAYRKYLKFHGIKL